jgi:glucose dehydrogenase
VSNELIFGIIIVVLIVVIARKWDSFKWIFALAIIALGIWTAFEMGMFDKQLEKVPGVEFTQP